MKRERLLLGLGLIGGACLAAVACGGDTDASDTPTCPAGTEGCPCYGNSTCHEGLTCASGLCVVATPGGDAATGGSGDTGGTAGSDGTAGTAGLGTGGADLTGGIGGGGADTGGIGGGDVDTGGTGGLIITGGTGPTIRDGGVGGLIRPTDAACATMAVVADLTPVNLILMLDRSGSMGAATVYDQAQRWDPVTAAMLEFLADPGTTGLQASLKFFPVLGGVDAACTLLAYETPDVPLQPLDSTQDFVNAIANTSPSGGTPTLPALQVGVSVLGHHTLRFDGRSTDRGAREAERVSPPPYPREASRAGCPSSTPWSPEAAPPLKLSKPGGQAWATGTFKLRRVAQPELRPTAGTAERARPV